MAAYAKPFHVYRHALPEEALADIPEAERYDLVCESLEFTASLIDSYARKQIDGLPIRGDRMDPEGVTHVGSGPAVTVTGTPAAIYHVLIVITYGGDLGIAVCNWSTNAGATWQAIDVTVPDDGVLVLGTTGLTATFAAGTYVTWETYLTDTVGPPPVLKRANAVLSAYDLLAGHGFNPEQGTDAITVRRAEQVMAWLKELAKSEVEAVKQTSTSDLDGDGLVDDQVQAGCVESEAARGW